MKSIYSFFVALNMSVLLILSVGQVYSQTISFNSTSLSGESLNNPTSLQFGPDGRLYVSQQDGIIHAYTIQRNGINDYEVTATEIITEINGIQNYNDDGTLNNTTKRQVTGILVVGTAANPVLYVTSSDWRIAVGNDSNLDTNSGMVTKLVKNGSGWTMIHVVRGLPRSEENHATNGLQLDEVNDILYVIQGGHTNKGAPGNNFAATPEYALSAALLSVDLGVIEAMTVKTDANSGEQYYYDLPTLDDPTRAGSPDNNDPFGGNDGLNQAIIVPGGPVQVYSPGYRNAYDVVFTSQNRLYTFDNGPNGGWGGQPVNEGPAGNCDNGFNESGSTGHGDGLHFISGPGYYGGHPNPTRGNPAGSFIKKFDKIGGNWVATDSFSWSDFPVPPVPFSMANPQECDYLIPGSEDGALAVIGSSTNGLAEYTASNFGGAMQGDLLAAAFNGNIYRFELNAAGDAQVGGYNSQTSIASNFGSQPLDVTAQGDGEIFPGTIWAATYGADNITIFEPNDFAICSTDSLNFNLDDDFDGYSNGDETANGTDRCNPSDMPDDFDQDNLSDLLDTDDDNDGIPDTTDFFAVDPNNGTATFLPIRYDFDNTDDGGLQGWGFTGLMNNGQTDYLNQYDLNKMSVGGAILKFGIEDIPAGDAYQAVNTQEYGFQFGVNVGGVTNKFFAHTQVESPYFNSQSPQNFQSMGMFIGTGDQDNYLKIVMNGGLQVLLEDGGSVTQTNYPISNILSSSQVDLYCYVDPGNNTAQPSYSLDDGATIIDLGSPLAIPASWLNSVLSVGMISTSTGPGAPFDATWDFYEVKEVPSDAQAFFSITPSGGINASAFGNNSFTLENTSSNGEKITSFSIDLSTAIFPDMIFDPAGTAGDNTAKPFQVDNFSGTPGFVSSSLSGFHNGSNADDGYDILTINFNDFDPGESLNFSIDVDPNSVKGTNAPGPGQAGSVSGLELNGATVTASFDNGNVHVAETYRSQPSSVSGSENIIRNVLPPAPQLQILDISSSPETVYLPNQTARVMAPAGSNVSLLLLEGALFEQPVGGYNLSPFDANSVINIQEFDGVAGAGDFIDFNITLTDSDPDGGLNYLTAVVTDVDGATSDNSNVIVLEYDSSAVPIPLYRVNAAGPQLASLDAFMDWSSDTQGNPSPFRSGGNNVSGGTGGTLGGSVPATTPPSIFDTERWDPPAAPEMSWDFPIAQQGNYEVRLYFKNNCTCTQNIGQRVFNVSIEGAAALSNYDIVADVGDQVGVMKSFVVNVSDGNLDIDFTRLTENPLINGIEILGNVAAPNVVTLSATPDPIHFFSQLINTTSAAQTITLSASGDDIEVTGVNITGANAAEFASDFTSSFTITSGSTGTFDMTFTPSAPGLRTAQLEISHDGDNSPLLIGLTGEGFDTITGGSPVICINAGGPDYIDVAGNPFNADTLFSTPSSTTSSTEAIDGTADDVIYQTERYGTTFDYSIDLPSGNYRVDLHFAEIYFGVVQGSTNSGQRVFNVDIEGSGALVDFDLNAEVTPLTAVVKTFFTDVTDGQLNIDFYLGPNGVNNAKVSAICIFSEDSIQLNTYYLDADNDGFGDANSTISASLPPAGYVEDNTDCNDSDSLEFPGQVWYEDFDQDQYASDVTLTSCLRPGATYYAGAELLATSGDCNDTLAAVNPAATEIDNGIDDNCNGIIDEGFGVPGTICINTGGPEYVSLAGDTFIADTYFTGGSTFSTATAIQNTDDDLIYQSERYDTPPMGYEIPVVNGSYRVDLHFADIFPGTNSVGARIFDVSIEGATVLSNYDIFADVGGFTAVVKSYVTMVTDDTLNINFNTIVDNAKISAICVIPADSSYWFADSDMDGFGNPNDSLLSATQPSGYVTDNTDCDDTDPLEFPGQLWYTDADMDGYGTGISIVDCERPTGLFAAIELTATSGDCNDNAFAINPDATEILDSIDNNCNGIVDEGFGPTEACVDLIITPTGGIAASTFNTGSFIIENNSPNQEKVTKVTIDLSTAIFQDVVFDPTGGAGDIGAKPFTPDGGKATTGQASHQFLSPRDGGFDILEISFTDFNPGETFTFSVDIDPTSIQGGGSTGAAGSVSGFEMTGATITIEVDSSITLFNQTYRIQPNSQSGSQTTVKSTKPAAPSIEVIGLTTDTATVVADMQTVRITGIAGTNVCLLAVEGELELVNVPNGGFDLDPYESNTAILINEFNATIGASGFVDIPVTLTKTDSTSGYNIFAAVEKDSTGRTGCLSNTIVLQLTDGTAWYRDFDMDGFGDNANSLIAAVQPVGYVMDNTDCNDSAFAINPGAVELLDSIDNNCNGIIDEGFGPTEACVDFQITPTGGINASTFGGGSFIITNNSPNQEKITKVTIDLSSAIFPDMVFDPVGGAGDAVGKDFTPNGGQASATGQVAHQFLSPHDGGFDILEISFTDFNPGETFTFSVDIDPTSIKDGGTSGFAGAVSGFELSGSNVTIEIDSNAVIANQTYRVQPNSQGGSETTVKVTKSAAPSIAVTGITTDTATVAVDSQTVRISGPIGADVCLLAVEGDLELVNVPNGGFDLDPYESNTAILINEFNATIGASGFVDIPVTLTKTDSTSGYNIYAAVVKDSTGRTGCLSNTIVLQLTDAVTWYRDFDMDGFGDNANTIIAGVQPIGYVLDNTDCNDSAFAINPAAVEILDSLDNNCDGEIDEGFGPSEACIDVKITPSGTINKTTFDAGSFIIENNSPNQEMITKVTIDLSTAIFQDMVFDPNGTGGDPGAKPFTPDAGQAATGQIAHQYLSPHDGGFDVLEITFNDFDPGETFTFSLDTDPTTIKGGSGTTLGGTVSGLELSGATITAIADGDDTLTNQTYRIQPGSVSGSQATLKLDKTDAPAIEVLGLSTDTAMTAITGQTVRVSGPAGSNVCLLALEGQLVLGSLSVGFDQDPYESNTAILINEFNATIGASGFVDIPVTLTKSNVDAGYNIFSATIKDSTGRTGCLSNTIVLQLTDGLTYYRDFDMDGFGDINNSVIAAIQPPGFILDNTDCNDSIFAANPGAVEILDGIDNNCDGFIDECLSAPIAVCKASITLDVGSANVSITPTQIDSGSSVECGLIILNVSPSSFDCSNVGNNTVTLTVSDTSGNSSTCTSNVIIEDNTAPIAVCPASIADVEIQEDGNGTLTANIGDNSSTDNCSGLIETSPSAAYICADTGRQMVILTATDASLSTDTAHCFFDVVDNDGNCDPACAVPKNLNVTMISYKSARLNWNVVSGAVGYIIQGRPVGSANTATINVSGGANNTFLANGLSPATFYEWTVQAVCVDDSLLNSGFAPLNTFATLTCSNPAPTFESNMTATSVKLNWTPIPGAIGYVLVGAKSGNPPVTINIPGQASNSFMVQNLTPGATYLWKVRSLCQLPNVASEAGQIRSFTLPLLRGSAKDAAGLSRNLKSGVGMIVYPNPTAGKFRIELSNMLKDGELSIYDMLGKKVMNERIVPGSDDYLDINMTEYESGNYVIRLIHGDDQIIERIMIQ